jgi:3-dehydroquinate synthetase
MICGYGEILKHSLIKDKKFFLWLSKNAKKIINNKDTNLLTMAIMKSCKIKSQIVSKDEKEQNLRMMLNFGHTFAHGFEGAKNFSNKLNHGEAVLLGMMVASQLSYKKKILSLKDLILLKKHYLSLNLPMNVKKKFKKKEINNIIYFMKNDKKNLSEKINLILIKKIGKTRPNSFAINSAELKKFLTSYYI